MSAAGGELERILAFERGTVELVAGEVRPIDAGWVVDTPSLPLVWSLNHLRIARPVSYEEALELCHQHHPPRQQLHIHIEHDQTGESLVEQFRADGWKLEVNLHLQLAGPPDDARVTAEVVEAGEDEALELMARWMREEEDETPAPTPAGLRQVIAHNRDVWRARNARRFGVRLSDGQLAAITMLFTDGALAQVEDVYAIPDARGHGFGRSLVTHAARTALDGRHELVFIVADDNDWPKHLYQGVGFQPVGRSWLFHRNAFSGRPGGSAA